MSNFEAIRFSKDVVRTLTYAINNIKEDYMLEGSKALKDMQKRYDMGFDTTFNGILTRLEEAKQAAENQYNDMVRLDEDFAIEDVVDER